MYINKKISILLYFILVGCNVQNKTTYDPIKDIPKEITNRYGQDMILSEDMALSIAEIIFKAHDKYNSFDDYKPFSINLVSDGRVWEIIAKPVSGNLHSVRKKYYLRLNKNTGEVLNFWTDK